MCISAMIDCTNVEFSFSHFSPCLSLPWVNEQTEFKMKCTNSLFSIEPMLIKLGTKNTKYVDYHYTNFQESACCNSESIHKLLSISQSPEIAFSTQTNF